MAQNKPNKPVFQQVEILPPDPPELPIIPIPGGAILKDGSFKSPNYVPGSRGWSINSEGEADFQDVTIFGTTLKTFFSVPPIPIISVERTIYLGNHTTAYFWQFTLPAAMIVNWISFNEREGTSAVASSFDLAVYSEDGQDKLFEVTTQSFPATLNGGQLCQTAVPSVRLLAGNYYLGMVLNSNSAEIGFYTGDFLGVPWDTLNGFDMTGNKPKFSGKKVVAAGILPSTFSPVSDLTELTSIQGGFLPFRLDN